MGKVGCSYFWRNNEDLARVWETTRKLLRRVPRRQLRWRTYSSMHAAITLPSKAKVASEQTPASALATAEPVPDEALPSPEALPDLTSPHLEPEEG